MNYEYEITISKSVLHYGGANIKQIGVGMGKNIDINNQEWWWWIGYEPNIIVMLSRSILGLKAY